MAVRQERRRSIMRAGPRHTCRFLLRGRNDGVPVTSSVPPSSRAGSVALEGDDGSDDLFGQDWSWQCSHCRCWRDSSSPSSSS
jgi:hypothetical protein